MTASSLSTTAPAGTPGPKPSSGSPSVVLAYSGGLDTTVILHWLTQKGYNVTAFLAKIGQKTEDLALIEERARKTGAVDFVAVDAGDQLLSDYFFPALVSHCQYEGRYLLGTSIARPLIAKEQLRLAMKIGAHYVAHGATGKGNDQVRFELTYQALNPHMGILPIWRDPAFIATFREGRKSMLEYAAVHKLEVKASTRMPWSSDDNRLHISYEAGLLEDPWLGAPKEIFERMCHPFDAPDKPLQFIIHWNRGFPVAVSSTRCITKSIEGLTVPTYEPDQVIMEGFPKVFDWIDKQAAAHGVGSLGMVESRYVGMKSRGEYHAPGHTVLLKAHYDMESICLTGSLIAEKEKRMPDFAAMVYNGYWYDPACQALKKFFLDTQTAVTGETRVSLYKGHVIIEGRRSPTGLYDTHVATMDGDGPAYSQQDASGFIHLHGLPLRMVRKAQNPPIDW